MVMKNTFQVNNAGVATFGTVEDTKMEEYDELFDTNLKGPFRLTQLAIPHLKKTKGRDLSWLNIYKKCFNILA